jgi:hypothetical protein
MGRLKQNLILNPSLKPGAIDITFLWNGTNTSIINRWINAIIIVVEYDSIIFLNQLIIPLIRMSPVCLKQNEPIMIRILANDGIHPDAVTLLNEAGYQVDDKKLSKEELIQFLPNYDVVIVRSATKIRRDLIDRCPNLKIIARAGVGLDNIDAAYARSKDITVMNTPDASSESSYV